MDIWIYSLLTRFLTAYNRRVQILLYVAQYEDLQAFYYNDLCMSMTRFPLLSSGYSTYYRFLYA